VIREADRNARSTSAIAKAYGIPLLTVSVYIKICGSLEQQGLHGCDISK
jgi:hypothetical protein